MAKKDAQEERLKSALAELAANGFAAEQLSADSVAGLRSRLGQSPDQDRAVVFLLGKIASAEAAVVLSELAASVADKELRKEVKRALFKLSQKGIVVAQPQPVEKKPVPLFEREAEIEASMSAVDGGGGRLVWIAKSQPNRGLQVIQAMIHDREGMLRFGAVHMKRKELRAMADGIKRDHGVSMIAIPWEFADQMIYEGYERAKARGQSGLADFHEVRSIIGRGKPRAVVHPVYDKLGTADLRDGPWREQSRRLLEEPELRYWVIVDDWMRDCLEALDEARTSRLVLNQVQKEERLASVVRDAVKKLCSGDYGQAFARRMEDTALYFVETGRPEQAKLALAVAQQVASGDPGPLDISFLTGLMQKSFVFFMSQQKAQQQEQAPESSLIVKP